MFYLIAAIIFTVKKRTGWSIFAWITFSFYFVLVIFAAAEGYLDEFRWWAGWILLLISVIISNKKPDDVVINNYYSAPSTNSPSRNIYTVNTVSNTALDNIPHIYFCPSCNRIYSGNSHSLETCSSCGAHLYETAIARDDWKAYSVDKKEYIKSEFSKKHFLRSNTAYKADVSGNNDVEEIKKYKALLDSGIITQEEFAAKKKQILGI